jgi:hypothetical protein
MDDDKVVPLHGIALTTPDAVSSDMREAVADLAAAAERQEVVAYAVVAILPNGSRLFRWHIPAQHALAMVGALTLTASDVRSKANT